VTAVIQERDRREDADVFAATHTGIAPAVALTTARLNVMRIGYLVVVILAVTPWHYVWQRYARAPGAPWR
jgi:hypothetical protein